MVALRKIIQKEDINKHIDKILNHNEISKVLNISTQILRKLSREYNLKTKPKLDENIWKRFGKLRVIEQVANSKDSRKVYKCKCDYGHFTEAKAKCLNNGDTRSCGAMKKTLHIINRKIIKKF